MLADTLRREFSYWLIDEKQTPQSFDNTSTVRHIDAGSPVRT